jgi:hypothetical protein
LYDGDKGRELKEQGFKCPSIVELRPPYDWNALVVIIFRPHMCYDEFDDEYNPDLD